MASKFFVLLQFVLICEPKRSLVPQAILQLVQSQFGENYAKIEVIYNSDRIEILDETLKLLGEVGELKITKTGGRFNFNNGYQIFLFDTAENFDRIYCEVDEYDGYVPQPTDVKNLVYIL